MCANQISKNGDRLMKIEIHNQNFYCRVNDGSKWTADPITRYDREVYKKRNSEYIKKDLDGVLDKWGLLPVPDRIIKALDLK